MADKDYIMVVEPADEPHTGLPFGYRAVQKRGTTTIVRREFTWALTPALARMAATRILDREQRQLDRKQRRYAKARKHSDA